MTCFPPVTTKSMQVFVGGTQEVLKVPLRLVPAVSSVVLHFTPSCIKLLSDRVKPPSQFETQTVVLIQQLLCIKCQGDTL